MNQLFATRFHAISFVAALLFGSAYSAHAAASASYPLVIKAKYGLAAAPECTLCHRDTVGGLGTVTRPFGLALISRYQLGPANVGSLEAALAGDEAEHLDSDSDGVPDIDELRAGTNPNVGSSGMEAAPDVPLPQTGCALAARSPSESGGLIASMLLGAVLWRVARSPLRRAVRLPNRTRRVTRK